jgi:hypothetical protein
MDLWRRWIRRQHSVWQVMREAGLEIRPGGAAQVRKQRWWIAAGVVALVIVALLGWASRQRPQAPVDAGDPNSRAEFSLQTVPDHAVISRNGQRMGIGSYQDALAVGPDHKMQLTAPGYADTEITVRLEAGVPVHSRIELRALRGDLRIVTRPAGAEITVDGQPQGTSPLLVRDLPVPVAHRVTASLDGYGPVETHVNLESGALTTADLALSIGRGELLVITDPAGAEVRVDGVPRGRSPARLEALPFGRHVVAAIRDGHLPAETTLVVSASTREIHLVLSRMPPGELVVQGDVPATIYIDGRLVVENVQNSGARELEPGEHMVRVVLLNNEVIDHPIEIRTRERAIYDFSRNTVTRRRQDTP